MDNASVGSEHVYLRMHSHAFFCAFCKKIMILLIRWESYPIPQLSIFSPSKTVDQTPYLEKERSDETC